MAILTLAACATLVVGGDSVVAIWQWAARSPQAVRMVRRSVRPCP
ncbi:hypothetical protein [Streptosporangium sp. CA-115845]